MSRKLTFDPSGRVEQPTFVLATKSGKKLGKLIGVDDWTVHTVLNGADEISFSVYKDCDSSENSLWQKIVDFKSVWYKEADEWFEINVDFKDSDSTVKFISGKSLCEAELSQINLYDIEINTEDDISRDDYTEPTVFYNESNHSASLLHRITDKVPNYSIGHVDDSLKNIQRKFSFDGKSLYDALMDISDEIECLFVFDSSSNVDGKPARIINAYDLKQTCDLCGNRFDSGDVCPDCGNEDINRGYGADTKIVVSRENLTNEINYSASQDDVKNCFRLVAGDDLMTAAVKSCNPNGSNYIWHITDDMKADMSDELVQKLKSYDKEYLKYQTSYNFEIDSAKYNVLVDKYVARNENLKHILSGGNRDKSAIVLSKFQSVVEAYYSAYDFGMYLETSMMPTVELSDPSVEDEIANLEANIEYIAITNLSASTSLATVETAVKSVAKIYVTTGKYDITIKTASWNNPIWKGTIQLTNRSDDTDTGMTSTIEATASADMETYVNQIVEKKLNNAASDDYDIVGLFHKSKDDFITALKLYSLDCLSAFKESCQTCVDVLIEQGCSSPEHDMYESEYVPWVNKLNAIENEMDVRSAEIKMISGDNGMIDQLNDIIQDVHSKLDFETYIGKDLWNEFLAYRREDEYQNSNYISDGLSNAELIENAQDFISIAEKELFKSAELQHKIEASLYNLLAINEFESLADSFAVGNWIWIIVDNQPYKLRLTEYEIKSSNFQNIDVVFSDVIKQLGGLSDIRSILDSASSMATSYGAVSRQASYGDNARKTISSWVQSGLDATNVKIVSNVDNQEMLIDGRGLLSRRYDDITEQFRPEQARLFNSSLVFTDDGWNTVKTALGLINNENGESVYGLIADNVIGKMIAGENLVIQSAADDGNGSSLFKVDKDGVSIKIKDSKTGTYIDLNGELGGIVSTVGNIDETIATKFEQYTDTLKLEAGSITDGQVSITLNAGGEEKTASIDVSGLVTYTSLSTAGATIIDAGNIQTGELSADRIKTGLLKDESGKNSWNMQTGDFSISGAISIYGDKDDNVDGLIGYMEGSTGSSSTSGIGVSNGAGDCYLIATDAGTRIQAGDYRINVTKQGAATMAGKDCTISILPNGESGSGVYITGPVYHRNTANDAWEAIH